MMPVSDYGPPTWEENAGDRAVSPVVDDEGNVYVTGYTGSTAGLATAGAFQTTHSGGTYDGFMARIDGTGTTKMWCTYWGGRGDDAGYALKMDPAGDLVALSSNGGFAGTLTVPSNDMASPGAMVTIPPGHRDVVIGKFLTDGARLWSTYYGGTGHDF